MPQITAVRLRIPELLEARKLSPYALAKALKGRVSRSAVYRLAAGEKVQLSLDEIAALCDALEVEPGELFDRKPVRNGAAKARR